MLEKFKKLKVNIGWKSLVLIGACIVLVLIDLITKIFEEKNGWNFTFLPKFIWVESGSRNPGCAFSFLANAAWGQTFLIVMTFILLALLIAVFVILPERFILLKISLSMITGGAIGNLIDRIAFREVRDFVIINMGFSQPICNFADFWIVIGTVIAVIDILFINEYSLFPLTKSAKAAQANRKEEEEAKTENSEMQETDTVNTETQNTNEHTTDENNG